MLSTTEWTLVMRLAQGNLLTTARPEDRLLEIFSEEFVGELDLNTKPAANAFSLIAAVRRRGYAGDVPPLLQLLEALAQQPSVATTDLGPRVTAIYERERARVAEERQRRAAAGDPFDMNVLTGAEVFLDRVELREALRRLHDQGRADHRPMLRVVGAASSGKSYTYRLIAELAEPCEFRPAVVFLEDSWDPIDVVRSLGWSVAPNEEPPTPLDDLPKWSGLAAQWLVTRARQSGETWWFVLDGLNHLSAGSPIWDLTQRLALAIENYGERRMRLVLLGHDGLVNHALRNRFIRDEARALEEADVREFFAAWLERRSRAELPPGAELDRAELDAAIDDTVSQVLAFAHEASAEGGCFMQELGRAIEEALQW
jgi:hypothetical protein